MKLIENANALRAFYFMMAADGAVTDDEVQKFNEIGVSIDPDGFQTYRDTLITECCGQIPGAVDDEYYDIVQECMDKALLSDAATEGNTVSARLLIWNMLAVAFSNIEYSDSERRMIGHVVRILGVDKSVFLEMEHLIRTAAAVERETEWIKATDKPYREVQPIVEELEKRVATIKRSVVALIDDEFVADEIYEVQADIVDKTKAYITDAVSPIAIKIEEKTMPVISEIDKKTKNALDSAKTKISETAAPIVGDISAKANKFFDSMKKHKSDAPHDEKGE